MPIRGETIGTAYVKILADGSGFPESVRDMVKKNQKEFEDLGENDSDAYQHGFNNQMDDFDDEFIKNLQTGLKRNAGRRDAIMEQVASDMFDPIDAEFEDRFGDIGKRMSLDLREGFEKSGGSSDFLDSFIEDLEKNFHKARLTMEAESQKLRAASERDAKQLSAEFRELTRQINEYHKSLDGSFSSRRRFLADLAELDERMRSLGETTDVYNREHANLRSQLQRTHPVLQKFSNLFDIFGRSAGRLFGKGSRNNFFNLFGTIIGFFSSLPGLIPKAIQKLVDFGVKMGSVFTEAGGGVSGFAAVAAKLTVTLVGVGVALGVLGGLLSAVVVIVGVLTSAIMSLIGVALALASSLAFALGGAITVAAGALVPLAAGIGVAILAFKNMSKDAKSAFKGITDGLKDLGKDASQNIFDSPIEDAKTFTKVIENLGKITGPVSEALGGLLDQFVASLQSPLFKNFETFLGTVLPGMVTSLGQIFGNLGTAFVGIFRAIAPSTQDFLDWLVDITQRFSDWVNSAEGKHSIKDFLDKAADSAEAVGEFLKKAVILVAQFFDAGKNTGDSAFFSLASTIQGWIDKLKVAKEDGTLDKWFRDAKKTADSIGRMVVELGHFIDELDTPENRQLVRELADAFIGVLRAINKAIPVVTTLYDLITGGGKTAQKAVEKIEGAFKSLGGVFRSVYNTLIGPALSLLIHAIAHVLDALGDMFGVLSSIPHAPKWIGQTADALHGAADKADGLAESIRNIPDANVKVTGPSAATISKIEGQLAGLTRPRTANIYVVTHYSNVNFDAGGGSHPPNHSPKVGAGSSGKAITQHIYMTSPTQDPGALAQELLNRMAAAAYI